MLVSKDSDSSMVSVDGGAAAKRTTPGDRSDSPRDIRVELSPLNQGERKNEAVASELKPFFVMDFLEQVDPKAVELARQMLKTPSKNRSSAPRPKHDSAESAAVRCDLFKSPYYRKSIDLGNGWNAKGLHKAKNNAWEDALACFENALEIRTQVLGEDHLDVANTCNNIGISLGKMGRADEALASLHRALQIRGKDGNHPHLVAATLHNIANVHQDTDELENAIQCLSEAKDLLEGAFGHQHLQVARTCVAMGHIYHQGGSFEDARLAYWDALSIFEKEGVPKDNIEVKATIEDVERVDKAIFRMAQPEG